MTTNTRLIDRIDDALNQAGKVLGGVTQMPQLQQARRRNGILRLSMLRAQAEILKGVNQILDSQIEEAEGAMKQPSSQTKRESITIKG